MHELLRIYKTDKVVLDDNFHLTTDNFSGLTLTFAEVRNRKKKEGTEEEFVYEDKYYYPLLSQALSKYLEISAKRTKTAEELLTTVSRVEQTINNLRERWNS